MFTRAGFNPRHRVILWARTWRRGRPVWACLVVWLPGADLGWYCTRPRHLGFLAWQLRGFADLIEGPAFRFRHGRSSSLEEAPSARGSGLSP